MNSHHLMATAVLIGVLFLMTAPAGAIEGAEIGIYAHSVWEPGVVAFENLLDLKDVSHERLTVDDVNSYELKDYYEALLFPGTYEAYDYSYDITSDGVAHITDLVANGGCYLGICWGACFACDQVRFLNISETWGFPLDLFPGTAFAPIESIAPYPEYTMTTINMNLANPINEFQPPSHVTLYTGGPYFEPDSGVVIDTVATYDDYRDYASIINFPYEEGRVLLIGPHPEIEEDSDRDGTDFAEELDDEGSEWGFLWSAMDWVLGSEITELSAEGPSRLPRARQITLQEIAPNPARTCVSAFYSLDAEIEETERIVTLRAYDSLGRCVASCTDPTPHSITHTVSWDLRSGDGERVPSGIYYLCVGVDGYNAADAKRLVVVR